MTDRRVALATCREFADLDDDDRLVIGELAARGIEAHPLVWDDASVDWAGFDLTVVRSTWDYVDRREEYLAWAQSVPRLANPADVLRWNTDKTYLRHLSAAGAPVVPTSWFSPGDPVALANDGVVVIKPSVGAGSRDAGRFDLADADDRDVAGKHVRQLLDRGQTVMVQPYLDAVDTHGETALLYFNGEFSHAIRKAALLADSDTEVDGLFREETIAARQPSVAERAAAQSVLAAAATQVGWPLLYARVDLLPGPDGVPVLLELELSEPSVFLAHDVGAASRFAAAIDARLVRAG
jgi:glutathione synthase/RimK-type ligase-like ATP-grasp enzyme